MVIRRLQCSDAAAYQQVRRYAFNAVPQLVDPLAEQKALCDLAELQTRMDNYEAEGIFPFGCFVASVVPALRDYILRKRRVRGDNSGMGCQTGWKRRALLSVASSGTSSQSIKWMR